MQRLVLAGLVSAALSLAGFAAEHKVPSREPFATLSIPDDWKTEEIEGRIEASSHDGEVYLAIEETGTDSIKEAVAQTLKYLKSKEVIVTESSMDQEEGKHGEMDVVDISWNGTNKDQAVKISLTIVALTKTEGLLVISWGSPASEKKHAEALAAITNSIKKP